MSFHIIHLISPTALCAASIEEQSTQGNLGSDLTPGRRIIGSSQDSYYDVSDVGLDNHHTNPGHRIMSSSKVDSIQNVPNYRRLINPKKPSFLSFDVDVLTTVFPWL